MQAICRSATVTVQLYMLQPRNKKLQIAQTQLSLHIKFELY